MENPFKKKTEDEIPSTAIIDNETAEEEFKRFCDGWEIDYDESVLNDDEKVDFKSLKTKIVKAIKNGRLFYNEDETLTYRFSNKVEKYTGKEVVIKRPKGGSYFEMDRYKDQQGVHKTFSILAAMTGRDTKYFSDVDGIDLKPLQAVMSLFLAS